MDLETLSNLGILTPNEVKIYLALLDLKEGSIDAITKKSGVHRRNAYDAIQRLIGKGLIFQVLPKKILTFSPVHPDKILELIDEKRKDLEDALPMLRNKFIQDSAPQAAYIFKGIGGLKNYINLILETGKDIYGIGSKGTWFDPRIKNFSIRAGKELEKKKIKSFLIYDWEMKDYPEVMRVIGKPYKFLPKKYSTGSSIDIFGDYIAIYSGVNIKELDQDITIFILKDKTLACDYKKWFDLLWDMLPKER